MILKEGDKAPDFELLDTHSKVITLNNFIGKKVVLYFYPKDNTPGCTTEAIGFNSLLSKFHDNNVEVVGISKDSIDSHQKFAKNCTLDIILLSDLSGSVCERYGVWKEKSMYGKRYFGIERSTFLIDETGVIKKIWFKVNVLHHAEEVLQVVCS